MNCPICNVQLITTPYESIPITVCPANHGRFVTYDELTAIIESRQEDRSTEEERQAIASEGAIAVRDIPEEPRACPECGQQMVKMNYAYQSGVIIDSCSEHGMWLDGSELDRIQAWVEAGEQLHATDTLEWQSKLDDIEVAQDDAWAASTRPENNWGDGKAYDGVGTVVEKVSRWWYRRDDAANHRS